MYAWRVRRPGPMDTEPLEYVSAPVPPPAASELLVAVRACGVCRTDLHVTEGDLPVHREKVTPGHEVVGQVVEVDWTGKVVWQANSNYVTYASRLPNGNVLASDLSDKVVREINRDGKEVWKQATAGQPFRTWRY